MLLINVSMSKEILVGLLIREYKPKPKPNSKSVKFRSGVIFIVGKVYINITNQEICFICFTRLNKLSRCSLKSFIFVPGGLYKHVIIIFLLLLASISMLTL